MRLDKLSFGKLDIKLERIIDCINNVNDESKTAEAELVKMFESAWERIKEITESLSSVPQPTDYSSIIKSIEKRLDGLEKRVEKLEKAKPIEKPIVAPKPVGRPKKTTT